ncbi:ATP-binding protein [Bradyrhizobium sp. JR3.5]
MGSLDILSEESGLVLRRGWREDTEGESGDVLIVFPASEQPTPASLDRIVREYSFKDELDSKWAARPLELVRDGGRTILVLEDPGGESLSNLLGNPIEVGRCLRIAIGTAVCLGKAHEHGFIHKDVKPANILVDETADEVRLTGFGIASRIARERQSPDPPEIIAGTLAYMAPEQTGRMNRSIDSRSDLYSFGITLYEMLTGRLPFAASDPMEWVHCHIARPPPAPREQVSEIPDVLSSIVMKLLEKTAEQRYQTASGLEADLRQCLREWQSRYCITPFLLGARDASDRLLIPEKLYGRDGEIATLIASFDRVVREGRPELVLFSGYSGIGKSSVVNELHRSLVPPRGFFASGKFDQYKRDVPYAIFAQAFQTLVRQILVKSEAEVDQRRRALLEALGPNGQLIVNLIPELEFIIGKQPPATELAPQEARARFQLVFLRFIGVFARPEHPLALFLDDLQWLDTASLDLLEYVATHPDVRHLLLIGAYRDNEVTSSHPLMRRLTVLRDRGVKVHDIVLAPLDVVDVQRLTADALPKSLESTAPLALSIHERTGGNPFFAIQLLTSLAEEGLLKFDRGVACWVWDLERIRAKGYSSNVAHLMLGKLRRLSQHTQSALQKFACLGNVAKIGLLSAALGQSDGEIHAVLSEAAYAGLIVRLEQSYAFLHDRIQEAAYVLISERERAAVHLGIGRLLLAKLGVDALAEYLFDVAGQLNSGAKMLVDGGEKAEVAEVNLQAGREAKASAAYASALKYFVTGVELLGEHGWVSHRDLIFQLELERAGCEFLVGDLAAADKRLAALSNRATNTLERASLASLHVDVCTTLDQSDRAIAVALEYLRHVGIKWSPHPTEHEARLEYERAPGLYSEAARLKNLSTCL